jgi:hypoxanthine phosphoribosyltransferase
MDLLRISWDATIEYCEQLALKTRDFRPEIIVGLSRGGLVLTRIMSDILAVEKVGIIGMSFYRGMKRLEKPEIFQELSMDVKDMRILLVDDVADSGKSLLKAKEYLQKKGAGEIRIATIHYKPGSSFKPDYYLMTTTSWVAYPWERHEMERELKKG